MMVFRIETDMRKTDRNEIQDQENKEITGSEQETSVQGDRRYSPSIELKEEKKNQQSISMIQSSIKN